jgi:hypothetical protein
MAPFNASYITQPFQIFLQEHTILAIALILAVVGWLTWTLSAPLRRSLVDDSVRAVIDPMSTSQESSPAASMVLSYAGNASHGSFYQGTCLRSCPLPSSMADQSADQTLLGVGEVLPGDLNVLTAGDEKKEGDGYYTITVLDDC